MAIFLTAAVAIATTRAAGRVGQLDWGPWDPEGAPSSMTFGGPTIPSHFSPFFHDFFLSVRNFWLLQKACSNLIKQACHELMTF